MSLYRDKYWRTGLPGARDFEKKDLAASDIPSWDATNGRWTTANLGDYASLAGNETVTGTWTFNTTPLGVTALYNGSNIRAESLDSGNDAGLKLRGTTNTALYLSSADGATRYGQVNHTHTNLYIDNFVTDNYIVLRGTHSSNGDRTMALFDPTDAVTLYNAGTVKALTATTGWSVRSSASASNPAVSTDAPGNGLINLQDSAGVPLGFVGYVSGSSALVMRQFIRSGLVAIQVAGSSGTILNAIIAGSTGTSTPQLGFYGTAAVSKQTVTGSRGSNAALGSALTALANMGLITNSTTA